MHKSINSTLVVNVLPAIIYVLPARADSFYWFYFVVIGSRWTNTGIKQSLGWLYFCLLTFSGMFLLGDALQKYFWNVVWVRSYNHKCGSNLLSDVDEMIFCVLTWVDVLDPRNAETLHSFPKSRCLSQKSSAKVPNCTMAKAESFKNLTESETRRSNRLELGRINSIWTTRLLMWSSQVIRQLANLQPVHLLNLPWTHLSNCTER